MILLLVPSQTCTESSIQSHQATSSWHSFTTSTSRRRSIGPEFNSNNWHWQQAWCRRKAAIRRWEPKKIIRCQMIGRGLLCHVTWLVNNRLEGAIQIYSKTEYLWYEKMMRMVTPQRVFFLQIYWVSNAVMRWYMLSPSDLPQFCSWQR